MLTQLTLPRVPTITLAGPKPEWKRRGCCQAVNLFGCLIFEFLWEIDTFFKVIIIFCQCFPHHLSHHVMFNFWWERSTPTTHIYFECYTYMNATWILIPVLFFIFISSTFNEISRKGTKEVEDWELNVLCCRSSVISFKLVPVFILRTNPQSWTTAQSSVEAASMKCHWSFSA